MTRMRTIVLTVSFGAVFFAQSGFSGENNAKVVTPKKGIAMARFGPGNAATANARWYYDWNNNPRTGTVPAGLTAPEFVPMIWGASNVTTQNINTLKAAQAAGTYTHLLGFNEPDMAGQANMTVAQAISLWPQLMQTGLILGSPAPSYTNAWFSDFMTQAAANNLRVDFICLHTYRPPNVAGTVAGMKTWITGVYNQYKKPIWVTEFGAPDCNALGWCGTAPALTQAQVDTYVKDVIAMLEDLPYVERYAWFVDASQTGFELSALFNADGSLSKTGTDFRDAQGTMVVKTIPHDRLNPSPVQPLDWLGDGKFACRLPMHQVHFRVSVFDVTGRSLSRIDGAGSGTVTAGGPDHLTLAKGMYVGTLETEGVSARTRFFVQ
jgi:hypothetical protein